jgi:Smg protein
MKDNIFSLIIQLFSAAKLDGQEQENLLDSLYNAGFKDDEISHALAWLDSFIEIPGPTAVIHNIMPTVRLFCPEEKEKINLKCRSFLMKLENLGLVNKVLREVIIDHCMNLKEKQTRFSQFQSICFLVLAKRGRNKYPRCLEELLLTSDAPIPAFH